MRRSIFPYLITLSVFLVMLAPLTALADYQELTDAQLAEVDSNSVYFDDLGLTVSDSGLILFDYDGDTDKIYRHGSGLFVITPVAGDYNTVNVNLDINIILITGNTVNIDLSDVNINF